MMIEYECDCCGSKTQLADAGEVLGHICEVCAWEYEAGDPESEYGPNQFPLSQARENYRKHGRCEPNWRGTWE